MVEMTSQGMNGAPLPAEGSYSTSIAAISFEGSSQWQTVFTDFTPITGTNPIYITYQGTCTANGIAGGRADVKTLHFSK